MYNQQVKYNSSTSAWEYSPIKYWPNGIDAANAENSPSHTATEGGVQKISFFAYAPYVANTITPVTDGIIAINGAVEKTGSDVGNDKAGEPTVDYKLKATNFTVAENVDLLWGTRGATTYNETDNSNNTVNPLPTSSPYAYNVNLTKQNVDEKVNFSFKHALAKIGGSEGLKIVADIDGNGAGEGGFGTLDGKTCITVRSISIKNKANATQTIGGTFNLATGAWSSPINGNIAVGALLNENIKDGTSDGNDATTDIVMNTNIYNADGTPTYTPGSGTWNPLGVTTTAKKVYNSDDLKGFYMIPVGEGHPLELTISVNYDITTYDTQINGNYVKVNQTITNDVTLDNLTPNKYYKIILHLGLTSVKFTASVENWEDASAGATEEVWLPSNVVAQSTEVEIASGQGATVNVANNQATYDIKLKECTTDNTISVKSKTGDGISGATANVTYTSGTSVAADGKAKVALTGISTNSTASARENVIVIEEKNGDDVVKTTKVTIIQAANP